MAERFPYPLEVQLPREAEGWETMYPYYMLFSEELRLYEEGKFWFLDRMHILEPVYPFDAVAPESWILALSQFTTRVFAIPPALGLDGRLLGGYLYWSPNAVTDPQEIAQRAVHFKERADFYFQNWPTLYDRWKKKVENLIVEMKQIPFEPLPALSSKQVVTKARGVGETYTLLVNYDRLIHLNYLVWQYHFEFLNLGYAAYLTFTDFCQKAFPTMALLTLTKMLSGVDVALFRPTEELQRLARLAWETKVAPILRREEPPERVFTALNQTENGRRWLSEWERIKEPWFCFSSGTGFNHQHTMWLDDPSIPLGHLRGYLGKLEKGETLQRPIDALRQEADGIAGEYRQLLSQKDQQAFDDLLKLCRMVFPYVEEHVFYIEHWFHTYFWYKVKEIARLLVEAGYLKEAEDFFLLNRDEVRQALFELCTVWAVGTGAARGQRYWPQLVERRRAIYEAFKAWSPPPALGKPPEVITEPFTVMLWGITSERVTGWLEGAAVGRVVIGHVGSPGVAEGSAKVILSVEELAKVELGDILVSPTTMPSWAPVFPKVRAVVTDIGGVMSHAAIVCREFGIPAVVGTGNATVAIRTGQTLRVDGTAGRVEVISE